MEKLMMPPHAGQGDADFLGHGPQLAELLFPSVLVEQAVIVAADAKGVGDAPGAEALLPVRGQADLHALEAQGLGPLQGLAHVAGGGEAELVDPNAHECSPLSLF